MTQTTERATSTADESTTERDGVGRRPLLKALGMGAALSLATGTASAHGDGGEADVHPQYGYPTPDAETIPDTIDPDHQVELHVADPTPGEHALLFHFEPTGLSVEVGDVVEFTATTPDHTITAYHPAMGFQRRVPESVPPFSSPVLNAGGAWLYEFQEAGLYDLYCGPHHPLGMVMRIVVGDLAESDVPPYEDTFEGEEGPPPLLAPFGRESLEHELETFSGPDRNIRPQWVWLTPREVLETPALDPKNIQCEDGEVSFDEVLADIDRISGSHEHE